MIRTRIIPGLNPNHKEPASMPPPTTTIEVRGIKVNTLIPPESLLALPVPPEPQPAGTVTLDVRLAGGPVLIRATINGKSVRKAVKLIAEQGPQGVIVLLQGNLKLPARPDEPFTLDAAGISATVKTSQPVPAVAEETHP